MRITKFVIVCVLMFGIAGGVNADVASLVGDKDGFGLAGAPAVPVSGDWTDFGGTFPMDNRTAGDPLFTDYWYFEQSEGPLSSPISWVHAYSLDGAPIAATLYLNEAGMSDGRGPWDVAFNGTSIGQIGVFPYDEAYTAFKLLSFAVPTGLLTGSDTVTLTYLDQQGEGFAINFSELAIRTTAAIPAPGAILLGTLGAGMVGWMRRRRAL